MYGVYHSEDTFASVLLAETNRDETELTMVFILDG